MKIFLKISFSLLIIALLFFYIDFGIFLEVIKLIDIYYFLMAMLVFFMSWMVAALKWKLLFDGNANFFVLLKINFISQFYNLILPGQIAGEAVKIYKINRRNNIGLLEASSSVIFDKITGLMGLCALGTYGFFSSSISLPYGLGEFVVLFFVIIILFTVLLRTKFFFNILSSKKLMKILGSGISLKIERFLDLMRGYCVKSNVLLLSFFCGFIFQILIVILYLLLAEALGIKQVNFGDWCLIISVVAIVVLVPISFGGIGVREGTFVVLLSFYGVSPENALSLSLSSFAIILSGIFIGGILELRDVINSKNIGNFLITKKVL